MMTSQELFDAVVNYSRTMKEKCQNDKGNCFYRGPNNNKCFIGALIPDEEYNPAWEGTVLGDQILLNRGRIDEKDKHLARDLQQVHDFYNPDDWENKFKELSKKYILAYASPNTVPTYMKKN